MNQQDHLSLHTDLYQMEMIYGHWASGTLNQRRVFEVFFRSNPFGNGFAVFAGLERMVEYLQSLHFTEQDLSYLREELGYPEGFLDELRQFRFSGDLHCVKEGTVIFPNEPMLRVEARIFEAQFIETALLNFINYQSVVATKAARIRQVAPNDQLLEFGLRRAQEADAALWGARAAYIAGFDATSNMRAGQRFGIPIKGTHAHSWVQDFSNELEAFRAFAMARPHNTILLVDTFDTLKSGIPNAIVVAKEMEQRGHRMNGIRLDSGDLAYLSIQARAMLDKAGLSYVKIVASNDLDEHLISELKLQGAPIDIWGIGTKLITAEDSPSLGAVYKLVAKVGDGVYTPTIKISSNPEKVTTPGKKRVYRIVNRESGKAEADYIAMAHEKVKGEKPLKLFDPVHTWIEKFVMEFDAIELLEPIFIQGQLVYDLPELSTIRAYHRKQLDLFWEEYLRKSNPERYPVDLSQEVWETKMDLIRCFNQKNK